MNRYYLCEMSPQFANKLGCGLDYTGPYRSGSGRFSDSASVTRFKVSYLRHSITRKHLAGGKQILHGLRGFLVAGFNVRNKDWGLRLAIE